MLDIKTSFYPIRIMAHQRNEVELEVDVLNTAASPLWIECDIKLPEAISLAPDRILTSGKTRMGIVIPGKSIKKKIKIYAGAQSYPDTYRIAYTIFAFGPDGVIAYRQDGKTDLRCLRFGEE
jgi:hypothetical protein